MNIFFVILIGCISIVVCNVKLKIIVTYKLLENLGNLKLKLFFIPIFSRDISFYGKLLKINKESAKALQIKINLSKKNVQYFKDISSLLSSKIYLQQLFLSSNVCIEDDTKNTALMTGAFNTIFGAIQNYLNTLNLWTKTDYYVSANYCCRSGINVKIYATIYFSLYDIIWAIIVAIYKRRKLYGQRS